MNVLFFVIACSTAAPEVPRVVACLVVFGNAVFCVSQKNENLAQKGTSDLLFRMVSVIILGTGIEWMKKLL